MGVAALAVLLAARLARVQITDPPALARAVSADGRGTLQYAVSTFGELSYADTFDVELRAPGAGNPHGCEPLPALNATAPARSVWLFERGVCTYAKKGFNGQQSGAFAVLVSHDSPDADVSRVIPVGDAVYNGIKVPIVLIAHAAGAQLREALAAGQRVFARLHFEVLGEKAARVSAELWLNPAFMQGYDFAVAFRGDLARLGDAVDFAVKYKYRDLSQEPLRDPRACYANGTFCATETHGFEPGSLLREGLRQICLFEASRAEGNHLDLWFRYAAGYKDCIAAKLATAVADYRPCFAKIAEKMALDAARVAAVEDCVQRSMERPEDPFASRNYLLEAHQNTDAYRSIFIVPALLLNGKLVKEALQPAVVLSAICEALSEKPAVCAPAPPASVFTPRNAYKGGLRAILGWSLLGVCAVVAAFWALRRSLGASLQREMNALIHNQVNEYYKYVDKTQ